MSNQIRVMHLPWLAAYLLPLFFRIQPVNFFTVKLASLLLVFLANNWVNRYSFMVIIKVVSFPWPCQKNI